jgi:hypothetical protein
MSIQFERYWFVNDGGYIQSLQENGGGGGIDNSGSTENPVSGFFDQQLIGIPASIPESVVQAASRQFNTVVITPQVLVEGFGSYLADILPPDIAITAGAFGASMQQIKRITQIPVEKFAQVVANIETTQGLDLVNGTNVPTDVAEAQVAYELVALGTGPYKTFTYSDFYGCMSGLPYPWQQLQLSLIDLQTSNLVNIYQALYDIIVAGPDPFDSPPYTTYNNNVQAQIDLANAEIALIRTVRPGASVDLNDIYDKFGTLLGNEQRARNTGLSPLPSPRDPYINKYSVVEYSFVDSLPLYGKQTQPNMAAQTLEAISDLTFVAGQSVIAALRQARNQDRLNYVGIPLDNNIPDFIEDQKEWISNTSVTTTVISPEGNISNVTSLVGNAVPAYATGVNPLGYYDTVTQTYNVYVVPIPAGAPGTGAPGRQAQPVDTGGPKAPGSLAKSPYQNLIPPQLSTLFTSDVLLPAQYSVPDAIEQVITCNCDCWI